MEKKDALMTLKPTKKYIDKININDALIKIIDEKSRNVISLIQKNIEKYQSVAFANSLGAEDMVLVDLIQKNKLHVEIFSIDTGRLPSETYDLIQKTEEKYQFKIKLYFPNQEKVETYVNTNGINAFYNSLDLRKACCAIRKVEPLNRALKDKKVATTVVAATLKFILNSLNIARLFSPLNAFPQREGFVAFYTFHTA